MASSAEEKRVMVPSVADLFDSVHPQMLRAPASGDPQKLAVARRATVAGWVERSLALLHVTKQDAAYQMGYTDPGVVSRWCSGAERPQFDKLLGIAGFDHAWLLAMAEVDTDVHLESVIRIPRRRGV